MMRRLDISSVERASSAKNLCRSGIERIRDRFRQDPELFRSQGTNNVFAVPF